MTGKTIDCPYCKKPQRITEPIEEDRPQEFQCRDCDRLFEVSASIIVNYTASCVEAEHDWAPYESKSLTGYQVCKNCDDLRSPKFQEVHAE